MITSQHAGRPPVSRGSQRTKDASYQFDHSYEKVDDLMADYSKKEQRYEDTIKHLNQQMDVVKK